MDKTFGGPVEFESISLKTTSELWALFPEWDQYALCLLVQDCGGKKQVLAICAGINVQSAIKRRIDADPIEYV